MSVRLCALAELSDSSAVRVELAQTDIAVMRVGEELFALEDLCSHADFPLSEGEIEGCTIECALHGSRFDLRTGKPLGPPATQAVKTFPVTVLDGDVYIDMEND
jgi:3-phenylpropionate/trans-cinnamate dioxygenase ferredoxin subunit